MKPKVWLALGGEAVVFALLLFGVADTVRWGGAWLFLAVFFGAALLITLRLARDDPALLDERMKPLAQKDQPPWDRFVLTFMFLAFIGWLVLMALDARHGWSSVPVALQLLGAIGVALAMAICGSAFRANTFLAPVVRIQQERAQTVVSTGPYAVLRHPMYAGALLLFLATPLNLGSWWGLAGSGVLGLGLVVRTALEDRELHRRLAGYPDYAARVRWRLLPHVW